MASLNSVVPEKYPPTDLAPEIDISQTRSCCGVEDIVNIQYYSHPDLCMRDICRRLWAIHPGDHADAYISASDKAKKKPACLYLFTGVVGIPKNTSYIRSTGVPYSSRGGIDYGQRLAAYIEEHKLGTVACGGVGLNKNYKDHEVSAWLWKVNEPALRRWWEKAKKDKHLMSLNYSKVTRETHRGDTVSDL